MRTQVGIIGAGPAGLMLSHLLHRQGISSVILEAHDRGYVEGRIRAGVIEDWTRKLLMEIGLGDRMVREGLEHHGINLSFGGTLHPIDFKSLIDKTVTVYGQHEVVKDLIAARLEAGGRMLFEAADASVHDFESDRPSIRFRRAGKAEVLECDFIAGCDGFHGVSRASIPERDLTVFEREYPFGWLGILTDSPPPNDELIYAYHERGFALYSMRAPKVSRLYVQCDPDDDVANWPDERVWQELHTRLGGTAKLAEGRVVQKGITAMRSFVAEPMRHGRLFLAGDAAHIVPPTGAKGMNLAFADVLILSRALDAYYRRGDAAQIEQYSATCLRRVWKAQRFSWWMTQMLHRFNREQDFNMQRQLAELDYVASSEFASKSLAENYVGLPFD